MLYYKYHELFFNCPGGYCEELLKMSSNQLQLSRTEVT